MGIFLLICTDQIINNTFVHIQGPTQANNSYTIIRDFWVGYELYIQFYIQCNYTAAWNGVLSIGNNLDNRWPHILLDEVRANTVMVSLSPEYLDTNFYAEIYGEIIPNHVHFFEIIITQTEYTFKIDGKNVTNNNIGIDKNYKSG